MSNINEPVVNRLREHREKSRLTQKEVAKLMDLDETTISKHESGSRGLSFNDVKKYASIYKVESFELFFSLNQNRTQTT